jgi:hypothetical protein
MDGSVIGHYLLAIVLITAVTGLGALIWYSFEKRWLTPHIYIDPYEICFILSQGSFRIKFDSLTFLGERADIKDMKELEGLEEQLGSIERFTRVTFPAECLLLEKDEETVAVTPIFKYANGILLHTRPDEKPKYMSVVDFQKNQYDIIGKASKI